MVDSDDDDHNNSDAEHCGESDDDHNQFRKSNSYRCSPLLYVCCSSSSSCTIVKSVFMSECMCMYMCVYFV